MKINGELVNIREVVEVELVRHNAKSLKLKVSGYPIGVFKEYSKIVPKPVAPVKATGVNSVKTGPEMKPDYEDKGFVEKWEEYQYLEKFFTICKCLEVDTSVKFDADFNTLDGLRKIPNELNAAGFSEGDVAKLLDTIRNATNIEAKAIEEAKETF